MRERLASGRRAFSQLSRRWPASGDATWKITLWCAIRGLLRFQRDSALWRRALDEILNARAAGIGQARVQPVVEALARVRGCYLEDHAMGPDPRTRANASTTG